MPTILHRLARWAKEDPEAIAQTFKKKDQWEPITTQEFLDRVYYLALFLESRGISKDDIGCILSANCPEWVHMDLATLLVGAKSAGIYPNSTSKDILYVLSHTEAKVLSVQNGEFFKKIVDENGRSSVPDRIQLLVAFDGDTSISPNAISYKAALAEGKKLSKSPGAKKLADYLSEINPKTGAFMIYTSGTTGNPKGALISHDNLVFSIDSVAKVWDLPFGKGTMFSFLPLCHIAEKLQNLGAGISLRYTVNFATKFDNVSKELPEIQPTLLLCVPRLWEKMMEGVMSKVEKAPVPRKMLAKWAFEVAKRVGDAKYAGRLPKPSDYLQYQLANRLVLGKVRQALGLSKAEVLASGAAALPVHVAKWFRCLGLEILEDFGQTESTGILCMTEPGVDSVGTVGKPAPGTELKIAGDGEILTRGRHVFVGYYKDVTATEKTLIDGWLHTGDLGEYTEKGLVRIKGRKKEVLKTSGGKMVAPLPIEEQLKAAPIISQVCMVGDGRKYLAALITLSESFLLEIKNKNGGVETIVITDKTVVDQVKKHVDELNTSLASYEQIKKFAVLSKEFSITDGEMTPTLKMKRNVIETRYREIIDQMYGAE